MLNSSKKNKLIKPSNTIILINMPSTRTDSKKEASLRKMVHKKAPESSWVMIMRNQVFNSLNISIISLPHPGLGKIAKYCLDETNNKIYEILTFDESYRSFFIGEAVKSDGKFYLSTPVNPTFLVLPLLRDQCKTRAMPLDDILVEQHFDKIKDIIPNLDHVADLKGPPDMKAYKYNEEKTLAWLEQRVRRVCDVLKQKHLHVTAGAVSATFVTSSKEETVDDEFYLRYAHGLISEYLEDDLIEILERRFNFKPDLVESLAKKRKSDAVESSGNISKKVKPEIADYGKENIITSPARVDVKPSKPSTLSTKAKAQQKAAKGSKSISSFFAKK